MWRRTTRDRAVILGLVLATIVVLTLDFRTGLFDGLSGATGQVVGVFQTGVRTLIRPVEAVVGSIGDFANLREENARLQRENEELRRRGETYTDIAREAARLRSLMQIEGSLEFDTVRARVIAASVSGLEQIVRIDKGGDDGIRRDTAVLAPEGLVGRVISVEGRTANVLLLTDSQSSVGVRIGETGETGIVGGTGGRLLRLELVNRAALDGGDVETGDGVFTSGYQGGIFPPGIPVGRVDEVELAQRGTTYRILVRPFARFSRLDVVSVVLGVERTEERRPRTTRGSTDEDDRPRATPARGSERDER